MRRAEVILFFCLWVLAPGVARAQQTCPPDVEICPLPPAAEAPAEQAREPMGTLVYFWGVGCPVCEEARAFVDALAREHPQLRIERVEVKKDARGRARFLAEARALGIAAPGVPTFTYEGRHVVGFRQGVTENEVRQMLVGGAKEHARIVLPVVGEIDPGRYSLPTLALFIGLLDGINPCAIWVLMVLLGILMHLRSRSRLLLFGGLFVLMSGLVYFLFMTVWMGLFTLVGLSRVITMLLGVAVLVMGLVNFKELLWFKKGPSLTIPDRVKPTLYRRMREVARAGSLPAAVIAILTLAFLVNLVELGCTIGLPAVYTRLLTLRQELTPAMRYAYVALYNVAYVVPLALVVAVFALTFHRLTLSERGAKILKAVSGTLLVLMGLLFLLAPDLLS